jgi:hypothetical protein
LVWANFGHDFSGHPKPDLIAPLSIVDFGPKPPFAICSYRCSAALRSSHSQWLNYSSSFKRLKVRATSLFAVALVCWQMVPDETLWRVAHVEGLNRLLTKSTHFNKYAKPTTRANTA